MSFQDSLAMESASSYSELVDDVIVKFLQVAVEFYEVVGTSYDPDAEPSMASAFTLLSVRLPALVKQLDVPSPNFEVQLITACRKVGHDLLIRIDRLHDLGFIQGGANLSSSMVCKVLPSADIDALGNRLHELVRTWIDTRNEAM
jgi:hypothetical protein